VSGGVNERPYLSIGEVLALLLEEFPDVTISKIRFLESQGLIEPERTASGYRKFFDPDVERLRVILREQRENFLPLRVIRDRLDSGEIDDSRPVEVPRGIRNVVPDVSDDTGPNVVHWAAARFAASADDDPFEDVGADVDLDGTGQLEVPHDVRRAGSGRHPAAMATPTAASNTVAPNALPPTPAPSPDPGSPTAPPVSAPATPYTSAPLTRTDLCARAGLTAAQLADLESFGLVVPRGSGVSSTYQDHDLVVARAAAGFLARGVEARHLKAWRQAAEREATLFEQRVAPLLRQRNPQSRQEAATMLADLAELGGSLRSGLLQALLQPARDT
jgi:DNA-binding transcriptional MerR regulator